MLDQFVVFVFVWAYSLRAQYFNLGWLSAQNYIMGNELTNSFNIYKIITEADSPVSLLSVLSDRVNPLPFDKIVSKANTVDVYKDGIYQNYLHYFKTNKFMEDKNEKLKLYRSKNCPSPIFIMAIKQPMKSEYIKTGRRAKKMIFTTIQGPLCAGTANNQTYFIGTLVTFNKGDQVMR